MEAAWEATHWDFCLLQDVKSKARSARMESSVFTVDRIGGLEDHLRNLGIEV